MASFGLLKCSHGIVKSSLPSRGSAILMDDGTYMYGSSDLKENEEIIVIVF